MSTQPVPAGVSPGGRPSKGERTQIAMRLPDAVLAGVDRQAARDGISRNDALILAARSYGDRADEETQTEEPAPKSAKSSGSRAYFGTDGIRGEANRHPMTAEVALRVGMAAGKMFMSSDDRRQMVVVGKDTRLSG